MSTIFNTQTIKSLLVEKKTPFNRFEILETYVSKGANFSVKIKLYGDDAECEETILIEESKLDDFQFALLTKEEIEELELHQSISKKMQLLLGYYISRKLKNQA